MDFLAIRQGFTASDTDSGDTMSAGKCPPHHLADRFLRFFESLQRKQRRRIAEIARSKLGLRFAADRGSQ
jgi:hypothetical protein